jgi:uncharacterized phage protein (TIGR02218 family)
VRVIPIDLAAHQALPATTIADALLVERLDGTVFGFTSADTDVTISSVLYHASPGLLVTQIDWSAGFNVDNLELTTLHDGTVFDQADILSGVWRNADFSLFRYNHADPTDGIDGLMTGTVGEVQLLQNTVVVELRGLQQYLQQPVGMVSTKTCRASFADFPQPASARALCGLTAASFTVTGEVTSVTSNQVFTDSALAQAADYFGEGILTWTTGPSTGQRAKVKLFSGGQFTLVSPMIGTVAVGHEFSVIAGCRKRLEEDCITKFNNVLNFHGEPHRPLVDQITKPARPSV